MENTIDHGHVPVLRERVAELLAPALCNTTTNPPIILDATLGAGGHSEYFLTTFPQVHIIGLDRDTTALAQATTRLASFGDRLTALHTRFDDFPIAIQAAADTGNITCQAALTEGISGALFDLGVSSMQLDQVNRGFAYRIDAPLDMRMNNSEGITAAEILNTYPHGNLTRILKTYGDERFASKIATAIIREREHAPFTTSARLVELLYDTIPAATRRTGGHPAKRTFQALRIEVNQELAAITNVLPRITDALAPTYIYIECEPKEGRLYFSVRNSVPLQPNPKHKCSGIGLPNLSRRLELLYGERFSLSQERLPQEYIVTLALPL